jgi:hypothetical protein
MKRKSLSSVTFVTKHLPKGLVRSHFATVHNGEKQYKCTLCDNSYTSRTMVIHHMGKAHDINPYDCSLCEKKFPSKHALKNHRSFVHEGKEEKEAV